MRAIVTGPFMMPAHDSEYVELGDQSSRKIARPSSKPERPCIVDIPAAAFARQRELGNVTTVEAFELRRKAENEINRKRSELETELARVEKIALLDVEDRALLEDFESLDGMDLGALVELAMRRKLRVNTRRAVDVVRRDVRAALEPAVERLTAPEPQKVAKP